jgi:hypothetical protein
MLTREEREAMPAKARAVGELAKLLKDVGDLPQHVVQLAEMVTMLEYARDAAEQKSTEAVKRPTEAEDTIADLNQKLFAKSQ